MIRHIRIVHQTVNQQIQLRVAEFVIIIPAVIIEDRITRILQIGEVCTDALARGGQIVIGFQFRNDLRLQKPMIYIRILAQDLQNRQYQQFLGCSRH